MTHTLSIAAVFLSLFPDNLCLCPESERMTTITADVYFIREGRRSKVFPMEILTAQSFGDIKDTILRDDDVRSNSDLQQGQPFWRLYFVTGTDSRRCDDADHLTITDVQKLIYRASMIELIEEQPTRDEQRIAELPDQPFRVQFHPSDAEPLAEWTMDLNTAVTSQDTIDAALQDNRTPPAVRTSMERWRLTIVQPLADDIEVLLDQPFFNYLRAGQDTSLVILRISTVNIGPGAPINNDANGDNMGLEFK